MCGPSGAVLPLEEVTLADDSGHAILANGVAATSSYPVTRITLTKINMWINAIGFLSLAVLLGVAGLPWMSVVFLFVGCHYGLPGPMPGADAQASFMGEFCLALCPVVWVSAQKWPIQWNATNVGSGMLSLCSLYGSFLLRQPIGMVGVLSSLLFLSARWFHQKKGERSFSVKHFFMLSVLILSCTLGARPLLLLRNTLWKFPPPTHVLYHGFSHTLYLGLGTGPNPWNINYNDDAVGAEAAIRVNPKAYYGTPLYFKTLRNLYLSTILDNPLAVLKIYFDKVKIVFSLPLLFCGINIFIFPAVILILGMCLKFSIKGPSANLNVILALAFSVCLFAVQGVLAKPDPMFLHPAKPIVLLTVGCALNLAVGRLLRPFFASHEN